MRLFLKILKWGFIVIAVAFAALVVYRMFVLWGEKKTDEQVAKIHATRLTLDDVMGKNLPPDPGTDADKTVQGIDANRNNIRDDVELAIFKLHPDSARIRAAELQYAMGLQIQFTEVFSESTFIAAIQEDGTGYGCILGTEPDIYPDLSKELLTQHKRIKDRVNEVENLILNTIERKSMYEHNYDKYMTSYSLLSGKNCHIDPTSLPN
ncbi:MAG: hypothetical protein WAP52_01485 [Candidatus Sungiibacteriota bacterium]